MAALAEITLGEHDTCFREGENKGLRHVKPGTKFRVAHIATQTKMICRFCQEARSTEHVYFPDMRL